MQTSDKGIAYQESREGVALKAYRCPAGIWTIGAGLTAASGVITPKAGMTISRDEARKLHRLALARNYEPAVSEAMAGARQHEFDGGVSFHTNTGAIGRASWVRLWRQQAAPARVRAALGEWRKGGGKVLPGLVRRRAEEADIILHDAWPKDISIAEKPKQATVAFAGVVISLTSAEMEAVRQGLRRLGHEPGPTAGSIWLKAVTDFQARHDLTVDGLIGRATLSTLQRELDARKATAKAGTTAAGGTAVAVGNEAAAPAAAPDAVPTDGTPIDILGDPLVTFAGIGLAVLAFAAFAWLAFTYRDLVAARVAARAPRLAAWLRSF